ncbi:squalene synthase HpnC [Undibacterium rugosum]|uniref:Squalene synthase HpnC n=1 Tax=Undibacterium rugosum TaxID=2762291 RepID=A0A923KZS3_9BURK|nr:squalene synthase HpnC [Undibacterium rugosum]MBC3936530.1 squalene synthase HpnC [Undibacterium rugosum]MBR7778043.1 squalene synthase HpnC [Undibacterium rugosum]
MSVDHYENFPVASLLMPAHLRPAVQAIYAFARHADDIADEGNYSSDWRLQRLQELDEDLDRLQHGGTCNHPLVSALVPHILKHRLPVPALRDLLSAFSQDVIKKRYQDFFELSDYCARSANPVGRLMLHLYQHVSPLNLQQSDAICSALQLINFWQDVAIDWDKDRIYLPLDDMGRFQVSESDIQTQNVNESWQALLRFQARRAREMLLAGSPLCKALGGRIGWELRFVVQGGLLILERIEQANCDIFRRRPVIKKADFPLLAWRALRM